jgi:hypothetical protein
LSGVSLLTVKKVFVEPLGNTVHTQAVVTMLSNGLRASGRFEPTPGRDEADAVLRVSAPTKTPGKTTPQSDQVSVKVLLVNANGDVLWPLKNKAEGASYSGSPADVATRIVTNLLRDIRRLERKR